MFKRLILLIALSVLVAAPLQAQHEDGDGRLYWWNDRVFYEIFVRSFYDSDSDGVGDLRGVIEKLDYLNDGDPNTTTDLGITGIWLMPINESVSYHGYDVTNYNQIEQDYGNLDDMRDLIREAHARGIAVIIDLVINHTSEQHPWFIASAANDPAYDDWYIWADENPRFGGPNNETVWHPRGDRFYYGFFWSGMPDLNLQNPVVRDELYAISREWLTDIGVDGFRLDAVKHFVEEGENQENTPSTLAWMADYNDYIDSISADALTVGEVYDSDYLSSQYVPEQVDLVFDFDFAVAILTTVNQNRPDAMRSITTRVADLYPFGQYATFITNHDQERVMSELRGNIDEAKMAASLLLTAPGVPFIYYGEEIGMSGRKPDENIRTPFRWDESPGGGFTQSDNLWQPLSDDDMSVSVSAQTTVEDSLLSHYRILIHLRTQHSALARGTITVLEVEGSRNIYAFMRETADETILVVLNLDDEPVTDYVLTLPDMQVNMTELLFGEGDLITLADGSGVYTPFQTLPAYSTFLIQLRGN